MEKDIFIIGAGLYGAVIFELAQHCGYNIKGFYDDDLKKSNKKIFDVSVLGTTKYLFNKNINLDNVNFAVAIGANHVRRRLSEKIREKGGITPSLIHKNAEISPSALIGKGVFIHAKAIIWTKVIIENDCIISPHVLISHHAIMKKGSFVSNMSVLGTNVFLGKDALVGMGSTVMSGINSIGDNVIIGAGSVVIRDVAPNTTVAGVPAKVIKRKGV